MATAQLLERPSGGSSAPAGAHHLEHRFSHPCRSGDRDVIAWSRKVWGLINQLSSCDGFEDVDIETKDTQAHHVPSEAGEDAWSSHAETEALLRWRDISPWHPGNEKVPVAENAVCSDPHGHCTRRLLEQLSGRRSLLGNGASSDSHEAASSIPEESKLSAQDVVVTVLLHDCKGVKEQEHDILASQTLEDLRDAFYFVGDLMYDGPTRLASACMFIDGVFYVDKRQASAGGYVDYSVELIEWLQTLNFPLRDAKSRSMSIRICDLEAIPFGEPCCFIRQGDIEHHMYFTGARLINQKVDCPLREGYPCLIWMRKYHRRRCVACLLNFASWVVLDSSRCPFNPAHFCTFCFNHFSEKRDGTYLLPADYKAFPYLHDEG
ncbi:SNAPC3 [Symbiodinium natans]|uniref:SNAPC3 protein n=1 Tax=Symbiodinium natans TaxID=878477 RepID=A0A812KLH1_9DINO|nr:SNAPC3 [Symbiodinium natans]